MTTMNWSAGRVRAPRWLVSYHCSLLTLGDSGEMATARGYGKPEVGIAHRTDISYDKDSSVFREWKDQSLWAGLPDVDKYALLVPLKCPALIHMFTARVYYNPNIDDHTLWRPRCDIFEEEQGRLRVEFEMPGVPR